MKNIILFATLIGASLSAFAKDGNDGGGGEVIAVDGQLYSYDLAELGLHDNTMIPEVPREKEKEWCQTTECATYRFTIDLGNGRSYTMSFIDDKNLNGFTSFSKLGSDFIGTAHCDDAFHETTPYPSKNCTGTPDVISAVGLWNLYRIIWAQSGLVAMKFWKAATDLIWVKVPFPLAKRHDAGSETMARWEFKYQIADRSNGIIRITKDGWDNPLPLYRYEPLNPVNKLAVLSHEIIYDMTSKHGDKDSADARLINGLLFRPGTDNAKKAVELLAKKIGIKI